MHGKKGVNYTQRKLEIHSKKVIRDKKSKSIPTSTPVPIPYYKSLLQLGDISVDVKTIDAHNVSKRNNFYDKACSTIMQQ